MWQRLPASWLEAQFHHCLPPLPFHQWCYHTGGAESTACSVWCHHPSPSSETTDLPRLCQSLVLGHHGREGAQLSPAQVIQRWPDHENNIGLEAILLPCGEVPQLEWNHDKQVVTWTAISSANFCPQLSELNLREGRLFQITGNQIMTWPLGFKGVSKISRVIFEVRTRYLSWEGSCSTWPPSYASLVVVLFLGKESLDAKEHFWNACIHLFTILFK